MIKTAEKQNDPERHVTTGMMSHGAICGEGLGSLGDMICQDMLDHTVSHFITNSCSNQAV
jgi:hypothetical protein